MKVKYAPEAEPLRKEQSGVTYFRPSGLKYAARAQANDRAKNRRQINKKGNLIAAARHWRNLPPEDKAAWQLFATNFPQPCKYAPSGFLSGYQIFIKRQQYCFLNYGLSNEFLQAPMIRELLPVHVDFSINASGQVIDVTENYIANFGLLPSPGQKLLFKCLPMATDSGQFFPVIEQVLTVDEVYMDGLFISLAIAPHTNPIVWSVYLSKPISAGRQYAGTKTRYMGCFTSKTFLQLLDTPSSYEGQAGKIVKVKADETGLEFGDAGGGGLTCESLPQCQTIIGIVSDIDDLFENVADLDNEKLECSTLLTCPTIQSLVTTQDIINEIIVQDLGYSFFRPKYGLLYNGRVFRNPVSIAPVGWRVPTIADFTALQAALGNFIEYGGACKESGYTYWNFPNTGATNAAKFNLRATGRRGTDGVFTALKLNTQLPTSEVVQSVLLRAYHFAYNNTNVLTIDQADYFGQPLRLVKESTILTEGQSGSVIGSSKRIYRTICVGGVEWTADNWCETVFRDGTPITNITDAAAWVAASVPAWCAYNNDITNAY